MESRSINVFSSGVPAGRIERNVQEEESLLFAYRERCEPRDAVSLTMPVRGAPYDAAGGLHPIFEMNLPEGAARERLRLRFAKVIPGFDDLEILRIVGASQIGRLRYSTNEAIREDVPELDLGLILTYRGTADLFANLVEQYAQHSGISGVQPKALVRDAALDKLTHRGATHIVKAFDSREYPELAANEWICTQGAAAAGIATAAMRLSANRQMLVIERFDLTPQGYLGVEDFCVLNGLRAHGRYDGSYENISRRIGDFISPGALTRAREQFALTVAYSCAIENGDAHLKNFSVIYRDPESEVALAPAYDLLCTTVYQANDVLALTFGGSKTFPRRGQMIAFIRHVTGKSERHALKLLDRVGVGVEEASRQAALYARKNSDAAGFAKALTRNIARGLERITAI